MQPLGGGQDLRASPLAWPWRRMCPLPPSPSKIQMASLGSVLISPLQGTGRNWPVFSKTIHGENATDCQYWALVPSIASGLLFKIDPWLVRARQLPLFPPRQHYHLNKMDGITNKLCAWRDNASAPWKLTLYLHLFARWRCCSGITISSYSPGGTRSGMLDI